ncbi:WecB/TagA/CpsF family glycosyltransferase [Patescibacteria group bacterium]
MQNITKNHNNYGTNVLEIEILNIKINFISLQKALSLIERWVETNKQYQITTPNPEQIILANKCYRFKKVLNDSQLAIADGIGLVWAAKKQKSKKTSKEKLKYFRLSGVDLMQELCKLAAKKKLRVFFLGGKNNTADKTAKHFAKTYNLQFYNYDAGALDIKNEENKEKIKIIKKVNKFKPHFMFVAYGAPYQELWIADNLKKLNVKVAMGVGGAFDYFSGQLKRAPKVLRKIGLEWLWRLIQQPWRVKRQFNLVRFVYLVLTS